MRINARVDALRLALLLDDALEDDAGGVRVPGPGRGGDGGGGGGFPGGFVTNPGCLAEAEVSSLVALVSLYPSTVAAEFTLGSLTVCDPRLPVDHPYRWAVRAAAANAANAVGLEDGVSYVSSWWTAGGGFLRDFRRRDGGGRGDVERERQAAAHARGFPQQARDGVSSLRRRDSSTASAKPTRAEKSLHPAKAADGEVGGSNPGGAAVRSTPFGSMSRSRRPRSSCRDPRATRPSRWSWTWVL